jgi:CRP-like cAMP-binding protein
VQHRQQNLQVALVGRTGLIGASVLLGAPRAVTQATVQFSGTAWRVPADAVAALIATYPNLHRRLLPSVNHLLGQIARTALVNGRGSIEQRVARWLLMAADCLGKTEIAITHEGLAKALGVRRASVTHSLHLLESYKAVRSTRGCVHVTDRWVLAGTAGGFLEPAPK